MLQKRQRASQKAVAGYQKVIITVIILGVLNLKMVQANCVDSVDSVDTQIKRHCHRGRLRELRALSDRVFPP